MRRSAAERLLVVATPGWPGSRDLGPREWERVVAAVAELCPRLEVLAPGACCLPARGPSRYFGGEEPLARRLVEAVRSAAGVDVGVGVADGLFAACLAAASVGASRGVLVVERGGSAEWLAPWPVAVLAAIPSLGLSPGGAVPEEMVDLLAGLGITTLGALASLPAKDVAGRFGSAGTAAHRLASGLDLRPLRLVSPEPEPRVAMAFDPPLERVDSAAFAARSLAERLQESLSCSGQACTRLAVVAETGTGERWERHWRHDPASGASALSERVRWQLEGWLAGAGAPPPASGLSLLALVAEEVVPAAGAQLALWGRSKTPPERVVRAVARLEGILGPGTVRVAEWRGARHPARAVAALPAGDLDLSGERSGTEPPAGFLTSGGVAGRVPGDDDQPPWPGRLPPPWPATVLEGPDRLPASITDEAGEEVVVDARACLSGQPARLRVADGPELWIAGWAGPWPVSERWWDARASRRQARFQVATEDGAAYLLVLEKGRWSVGAVYD